ncbi:hypothetical protein D3C73_1186640 [compost metagenome]
MLKSSIVLLVFTTPLMPVPLRFTLRLVAPVLVLSRVPVAGPPVVGLKRTYTPGEALASTAV